ncbi:MAG TPA: PadR family transcriptional regulator [Acidimicrobiales bacterium]|nr:PadR family transcriptional regulator [Acidimicrobiales bacterium]
MLELAILGVLMDHEQHGYELKKRLGETISPLSSVSFGSLYPALARLEAAGAVKVVEARTGAPPMPMTGSLGAEVAAFRARRGPTRGSRGKKVYGITERGHELFAELLTASSQPPEDDRGFSLRLAFARHLPPEARLGLLERRRAQLVERLAKARSSIRSSRDRLDSYARSLLEHGSEATERDISWLDQLIAAESAASDSRKKETT